MKSHKFSIDNQKLREIRNNTDWQTLFHALGIRKDERKSKPHDWWGYSPFAEEKTPSFHLNNKGFFCFSTQKGGGVIELVQEVIKHQTGESLNCYQAGQWLIDNGVSSVGNSSRPDSASSLKHPKEAEPKPQVNKPISQDLIPMMSMQGTHPEFVRRGISKQTCQYLGCGYIDDPKSQMHQRITFQVCGVETDTHGNLKPVILTHTGRATNQKQIDSAGKWRSYKGFIKTLELYNLDHLLLDPRAREQAQQSGQVIITEGCFDVAKLIEAGIYNAVATFGAHLAQDQLSRLHFISKRLGVHNCLVWFDRDKAGRTGQNTAISLLNETGFKAEGFDWDINFLSYERERTPIAANIRDVCDFSVERLKWFRSGRFI